MDEQLKDKIEEATEASSIDRADFLDLLRLVDAHYDQMEATISQALATQSLAASTPIDVIFDSVTEALFSVSESGEILTCNQVSARYFCTDKSALIGASLDTLIPDAAGWTTAEFLAPFIADSSTAIRRN